MSCCNIVFDSTSYISQTNERLSFLIHCSGASVEKWSENLVSLPNEFAGVKFALRRPCSLNVNERSLEKKRGRQMNWKTRVTSRPLKRKTYRTLLHDSLHQRCCLENWCEKSKSPIANHCRYILQATWVLAT